MAPYETIVKNVDTVLNCIPIVSTVNNIAQALYKLAHKVDAFNPVASGLKAKIQIHVLSKDLFYDCFLEAIPGIGNFFAFCKFLTSLLNGFTNDLLTAVTRNDQEVIELCLKNQIPNDLRRASEALTQAVKSSDSQTFKKILAMRDDWTANSLIYALPPLFNTVPNQVLSNVQQILQYVKDHSIALTQDHLHVVIYTIEYSLRIERSESVQLALDILPNEIPFKTLKSPLLQERSCSPHYRAAQATNKDGFEEIKGISLTKEQRHLLITKCQKPTFSDLIGYYKDVKYHSITTRTADGYLETQFDNLLRLLDRAELTLEERTSFIECLDKPLDGYNHSGWVRNPTSDPSKRPERISAEFQFLEALLEKYSKCVGSILIVRYGRSDLLAWHQKDYQTNARPKDLFYSMLEKYNRLREEGSSGENEPTQEEISVAFFPELFHGSTSREERARRLASWVEKQKEIEQANAAYSASLAKKSETARETESATEQN